MEKNPPSPSTGNLPPIYSLASSFASLPPEAQAEWITHLRTHPKATAGLLYDWPQWARPNQLPPTGKWHVWLLLAGRGFGKTRTGAEWVRAQVESGRCGRLALVAPTSGDVRDVMVEGESGLLAISPPWFRPEYQPSNRRLTWPNGAQATTYSADEPERLRGPQHDGAWADELAAWRYPEAWDQLMFGLRLGRDPRCVVTTTPKPTPLIRALRDRDGSGVHITRGSTYDNRANLAQTFIEEIVSKYEGTRLGLQELHAEILDDSEAALWKREWFDAQRRSEAPAIQRVVVAVDPAASKTMESDETGIIVCALGADGRGYVLADRSGRYSPDGWARAAIKAWSEFGANTIVAERNNGGEMVEHTIKATAQQLREQVGGSVPVKTVWASQGKFARAEPVAALYEQGRVSHIGTFAALEGQCCTWEPHGGDRSPDRLDALVWGLTELMVKAAPVAQTIRTTGW